MKKMLKMNKKLLLLSGNGMTHSTVKCSLKAWDASHLPKSFGNFGQKLNGKIHFGSGPL